MEVGKGLTFSYNWSSVVTLRNGGINKISGNAGIYAGPFIRRTKHAAGGNPERLILIAPKPVFNVTFAS